MAEVRRESMRIAGEHVACERVIEVENPWNGEVVGTVPRATVADVRRAFTAARLPRALSRHERSLILTAPPSVSPPGARRSRTSSPRNPASARRTRSTRWGAPGDVFTFAAHAALGDDSQTFPAT